ncbi:MAG TPA: metallophosphoesterase [Nitriliruptorales bacterium]|nr:metallophosphoesterase [Nitriliruptorales bacterium]
MTREDDPEDGGGFRIAAVGDIHVGTDSVGRLGRHLRDLDRHADVLLLAGDLSRGGRVEEAEVLAAELADVPVPIVAVLGNHDLHSGRAEEFRAVLVSCGVAVLEGENTVVDTPRGRVGVAGTIGFGGGFPGGACSDFGEAEMKAFVARAREVAERLETGLRGLAGRATGVRVALTHYAPVRATLVGENPEIFPFLGSYLLAEVADRAGADLYVHGHAHHGVEKGTTPHGIPVRNVAQPVIRRPFAVYRLHANGGEAPPSRASGRTGSAAATSATR